MQADARTSRRRSATFVYRWAFMILDRNVVEQEIAALNLPPNIVRLTQGRRAVLKFLAAQPLLLAGIAGTRPPLYIRKGADFKFHCTEGYPEVWHTVYRESLEHFAGKWGKVGPLHVFLIENSDWQPKEAAKKKDAKLRKGSWCSFLKAIEWSFAPWPARFHFRRKAPHL